MAENGQIGTKAKRIICWKFDVIDYERRGVVGWKKAIAQILARIYYAKRTPIEGIQWQGTKGPDRNVSSLIALGNLQLLPLDSKLDNFHWLTLQSVREFPNLQYWEAIIRFKHIFPKKLHKHSDESSVNGWNSMTQILASGKSNFIITDCLLCLLLYPVFSLCHSIANLKATQHTEANWVEWWA